MVTLDRWYTALLGSKPVGWVHTTVIHTDRAIETKEEMSITLRRGEHAVTTMLAARFVETVDGKPLEASSTMQLADRQITQTYQFESDRIVHTTVQGDRRHTQTRPLPQGDWMTPVVAEQYLRRQLEAGAMKVSYRTISAATGPTVIETTHTVKGKATIEVLGKMIPATQLSTTVSIMPGTASTAYVDHAGSIVKTTVNLNVLKLDIVLSDRQLATSGVDPPELIAKTLVVPDRPIQDPRKLRSALYELRMIDDDGQAWNSNILNALPTVGCQRVVQRVGNSVRLQIDIDRPVTITAAPPDKTYRQASAMIDSDHPQIIELVHEAIGNQGSSASESTSNQDKAWQMCRFVHRYIRARDLSVGFASASEVAATAQGDCSEFAVLLAAMLRAVGIPSRTVSGLVYVDRFLGQEHVFGYHMWTQAWIQQPTGGRWLDLDGSLNPTQFDATHITLATSSLEDGRYFNDLASMVPLLGRLSIRVLDLSEADGTDIGAK